MVKTTINQASLREGDIIAFREKIAGTDKTRTQYGIFVANQYKNRDTVGFQVLPLTPYPKEQRIPNDDRHLMISGKGSINSMGLNPDVNWRIQYKFQGVRNTPRALGVTDAGKITKMGELDTRLYNSVFNYLERTLGTPDAPDTSALLGLGKSGPRGLRTDRTMERIVELGGVERGRTVEGERKRQKAAETGADLNSKEPKKYKARKPIGGRQIDISLTDAEKLNLITKETRELLERGNDKNAPKIKTLREAFSYFSDRPEAIATYLNPEADVGYDDSFDTGKSDVTEDDNIAFSAIAEVIGEKRGLTEPLSWAQTAAFVSFFPDVYKQAAGKKTHFNKPISKLMASWQETAGTENITVDLKKSLREIETGWQTFLQSEPYKNPKYSGIEIMHPVRSL